jgi:outer membrane protein insertion porin family
MSKAGQSLRNPSIKVFSESFKGAILFIIVFSFSMVWYSSAVWAQDYIFSKIQVEGNRRIESSTIKSYSGLKVSQAVTAAELNTAYQDIVASGLFEMVEILPSGSSLFITVKEFPTINRVAFEGNSKLKNDVLVRLVKSRSRKVFNPTDVEQDRGLITQAYADMGRLAATVGAKIIRQSDNRVDLIFEIFEGGLVEIERIGFVGNRVYADRKLRGILQTKQAGFLRSFIQRDTFVEDRIEFDKQVLVDFYKSRGYVDFRINSVNAEFSQERDGYFITFNIREGQQFKVGSISMQTNVANIDPASFSTVLKMKKGQLYAPVALENDIARMERYANQEGLEFVKFTPKISRDASNLLLNVNYVLERGPRLFVERIDIEGNTATLDRVVRRQFRIVEGDPFNAREIRASARRIRALGFFADVSVTTREGSGPEKVIIEVNVVEKPTGSLNFGAAYSTAAGLGGTIEYGEKNFLGRGQSLNFKVNAGTGNQTYSFDFSEPSFLYQDLSLSLGAAYRETQQQYSNYNTTAIQIRPQVSFPISEQARMGIRYFYSATELSEISTSSGSIVNLEKDLGRVNHSGVGFTLSYDTRRTGLDPNAGILLRLGQDFSGLGGDATRIKTTGRLSGEMKVLGEEVTLVSTLEGGLLSYSRGQSRVTDRFLMGSNVLRGFSPAGIGPREYDFDAGVNDALGGDKYAAMRLEALFPLGIPEEYGISGGIYYDIGNLWGLEYGAEEYPLKYESGSWRQSLGFSLFWKTPVAPFRFNFSRVIAKQPLDVVSEFELTLAINRF